MTSGGRRQPAQRGLIAVALALGLLMLLHDEIPNRIGNLGSLIETFLPWFGLFVPLLLGVAVWRRSPSAMGALLVPSAVWLHLFGGLLVDKSRTGQDLIVATHNVWAENPDPSGTARAMAASRADVLALVEITDHAREAYERGLARTFPFHVIQGTIGLWSKLPLSGFRLVDDETDVGPAADTIPVDVKQASTRMLRATVATQRGPLVVYVAHLGSARLLAGEGFRTGSRDRGARALAKAIAAERVERVVLLGDLNGTLDDRTFAPLASQMRSAQTEAGDGFGFSWPARFPVVRIDQILIRGMKPKRSWVLAPTGSDHLPVAAALSW